MTPRPDRRDRQRRMARGPRAPTERSVLGEPSPTRVFAFVIAIMGSLAATALGVVWLGRAAVLREQLTFTRSAGVPVDSITAAGYLLVATIGLGPLGAFLILRHRARLAAAVLFAAAAAPAALEPRSLTFNFALIVAGLLALAASVHDHRTLSAAPPQRYRPRR